MSHSFTEPQNTDTRDTASLITHNNDSTNTRPTNRNQPNKSGKKNKQPLYKRIPRIVLWILFYTHCLVLSITIFPLYATPYFSISGPQQLWEGSADLAEVCNGPMPPQTQLMLRSTTLRGDLQDENITVQAALFVRPLGYVNTTSDRSDTLLDAHDAGIGEEEAGEVLLDEHAVTDRDGDFRVNITEPTSIDAVSPAASDTPNHSRWICPELFESVDVTQDIAWKYYQNIGLTCTLNMSKNIEFMPFSKEHIENSTDYNGFCERSQHSSPLSFNLSSVRTASPLKLHIRLLDRGLKNHPAPECHHASECQSFFENLKYNHTVPKFRRVIEAPVCHGGQCAAALHLPKEKNACDNDHGAHDTGSARQCENKHCVFQVFWMATPELPRILSVWTLWSWPTLLSIMGLVVWVGCGMWLARRWHLAYLQNYYVRSNVFSVQAGSVYDVKLILTGSQFSRYSGCFTLTAEEEEEEETIIYNNNSNSSSNNNNSNSNNQEINNPNGRHNDHSESSQKNKARLWADLRRGWDDTAVAGEEGQHLLHRYPFNVTLDEEDYEGGTQVSVVLRTTYRAVQSHSRVSFDVQWGNEFTTAHFQAPIVQIVIRKQVPTTVKTRLNVLLMPLFFLSHFIFRIPRRSSFVKYADYIFLVLFISAVHCVWLFFFASNMLTNFLPQAFWGSASERPFLPLLCYITLVVCVLTTAILSRLPFCRRPPRMPRAIRRRAKKLGLPKERNAFLIEPSAHEGSQIGEPQSHQQLNVIPIPDNDTSGRITDHEHHDHHDNGGGRSQGGGSMSFELGPSPSSPSQGIGGASPSSSLASSPSFPARRFATTSERYRRSATKPKDGYPKRRSGATSAPRTHDNTPEGETKPLSRGGVGAATETSDSDAESGSMIPLTSTASWRDHLSQLDHTHSSGNTQDRQQTASNNPEISVRVEGHDAFRSGDGVEVEAADTPLWAPASSNPNYESDDHNNDGSSSKNVKFFG